MLQASFSLTNTIAMVCASGLISPHKHHSHGVCDQMCVSPWNSSATVCVFQAWCPLTDQQAVVCDSPRVPSGARLRSCRCPPTPGRESHLHSCLSTDRGWVRPFSCPHKKQWLPFGEKDVQVLRFTEIVKHHKLSLMTKKEKR